MIARVNGSPLLWSGDLPSFARNGAEVTIVARHGAEAKELSAAVRAPP
jgi:hypothetical protein